MKVMVGEEIFESSLGRPVSVIIGQDDLPILATSIEDVKKYKSEAYLMISNLPSEDKKILEDIGVKFNNWKTEHKYAILSAIEGVNYQIEYVDGFQIIKDENGHIVEQQVDNIKDAIDDILDPSNEWKYGKNA